MVIERAGFQDSTQPQRVVIVGIRLGRMTRSQMEASLAELARLIDTAGGQVVARASQEIHRVDAATFIGKGKVEEIGALAAEHEAEIIVVDGELSPVQNRNLETSTGLLVLDRTAVILDIFARRARTSEGKLQVELAQYEYLSTRLVGRGKTFSQQAGHIGTRGPGETALEYDRRRIRERITKLKRSLSHVQAHREIQRAKREAVPLPFVSLVGYTNAGKSTLMNALTRAGVFVEDKLFATLDPTVRRLRLPSGREVLLADTVGFIRRLPHQLIESFKSTFEEAAHAHLLVHLIDGADEDAAQHVEVVEKVLAELGLHQKPRLDVINKADLPGAIYRGEAGAIAVSAKGGSGLNELLGRVDEILRLDFHRTVLKLPHSRGEVLSQLYRVGFVINVVYEETGTLVDCELHRKFWKKYREYEVSAE